MTQAYDSSDNVLELLTNGVFETSDSIQFNRVDLAIGATIRFDFGQTRTIDTISISAGNAAWGGSEMPKDIDVYIYDDQWIKHQTITYETSAQNSRDAAERHDIEIANVTTSQFKLCFLNTCGNSSIVVRQVSFGSSSSDDDDITIPAISMQGEINQLCTDVINCFAELQQDRDTVETCRSVLGQICESGVAVSAAFEPLEAQSGAIAAKETAFLQRLTSIKSNLETLLQDMQQECQIVGPLDAIEIK